MEKKQITNWPALGITGAWLAVALFVMSKHEIWLDEAQHWLLARDSNSLRDLYANMKYEGHPPLWNLLLFALSAFSDSPDIMQYAHLVFAGATVFLIVRFSPFPFPVKVLLPFTYFLGYEYAIIARNYAPAVFFIVLACVWNTDQKKNLLKVTLALGVAICFHIYAAAIAFPMLMILLWRRRTVSPESGWSLKYMGILTIFVLVAGYFLFRVPSDHFMYEFKSGLFNMNKLGSTLLLPFTSLLHFPELNGTAWWNSNLFLQGPNAWKAIIGVIFWLIPAAVFLKEKSVLAMYLAGTLLLSIVVLISPSFVVVRHAGFIAVLFFVCLWLYGDQIFSKGSKTVLAIFLVVQLGAYLVTAFKECTQPFSHAKNVAEFIETEYPEMKIAVYPMYIGPPISAYLGQPVFYGQYNSRGSYSDWSRDGFTLQEEDLIAQCKSYMKQEQLDSMVLVGPSDKTYFYIKSPEAQFRAKFDGAAVMPENYNVYVLKNE